MNKKLTLLLILACLSSCDIQSSFSYSYSESNQTSLSSENTSSESVSSSFLSSQSSSESLESSSSESEISSSSSELISSSSSSSSVEENLTLEDIDLAIIPDVPRAAHFRNEVGEEVVRSLRPSDINNLPIIELNGDVSEISKDNKVTVSANYITNEKNIESFATIKWQGASSSTYDKKNYSITFVDEDGDKNKLLLNESWGKQSKYCLKANWIDFSHCRNVVSGKLMNQIIKSRGLGDEIEKLNNGGVVDGYPSVLYLNGEYQGIYTVNIPKDKWMFGMKGSANKQAVLFCNAWSEKGEFLEPLDEDFGYGWEAEYCSTEDAVDGYAWAIESINEVINFTLNSEYTTFIEKISEYVSLERVIDVIIFTSFISGEDNVSKNINWITYDGKKWIPQMYDMDGTWGLMWHGESYTSASSYMLPDYVMNKVETNKLFKRIYKHFIVQIKERYKELREYYLNVNHISAEFSSFYKSIPEILRTIELKKWEGIPNPTENNLDQITTWAYKRGKAYDSFYA